ncbi:MAG: MerR family transcriptional regulator [Clostridia bacterium]|nr:MerR family transcriptional regulator [Clostridia bacterium]
MKDYFSISQTAKIVDMTTETLRHYDRIDLVKPSKIDEWTGYRYYSQQEIVRLNTIRALRCMDLTLSEIKDILAYNDFDKIIATLKQAEKSADEKIAELNYAKTKIQRARIFYESKLNGEQQSENIFIKHYPQRVILLSDTMETPTLDNLWNYHRHFYDQISEKRRNEFSFEDLAGIYEQNGLSRLFAICTRYSKIDGIKILPQGNYLCADCTEENREEIINKLFKTAKSKYNTSPEFTIQLIVLSGILQWNYQAQIYIPT